jgi:hypothetical protein
MVIARNFVEHGVWGLTPFEFSSASSSPLWTALLAVIGWITGRFLFVPWILNLVAAAMLLALANRSMRRDRIATTGRSTTLVLLLLVTPLPTLVFNGLEHSLHAVLMLGFLLAVSEHIAAKSPTEKPLPSLGRWVLLLAFLLPVVRYESFAAILTAACLYALRRRVGFGLLLLGVSLILPGAVGWVSVAHGHYWLPSSILVKSPGLVSLTSPAAFYYRFVLGALRVSLPFVFALLALGSAYVRFRRPGSGWDRRGVLGTLFAVQALAHMTFGIFGWMVRYDAYVIATGIVVTALLYHELIPGIVRNARSVRFRLPHAVMLVLFLYILNPVANDLKNRLRSITRIPVNVGSIQRQHVQIGLFLAEFYEGESVVVNDVGAVCLIAELRLFDPFGLGSPEVVRLTLLGKYDTTAIARLAREHGSRIAVVNEEFFREQGGFPTEWVKVAEWEIADCVYCAPIVSFFAIDPSEAVRLRSALEQFSPTLPAGVIQRSQVWRKGTDAGRNGGRVDGAPRRLRDRSGNHGHGTSLPWVRPGDRSR